MHFFSSSIAHVYKINICEQANISENINAEGDQDCCNMISYFFYLSIS